MVKVGHAGIANSGFGQLDVQDEPFPPETVCSRMRASYGYEEPCESRGSCTDL
jgi:hypothetical protein